MSRSLLGCSTISMKQIFISLIFGVLFMSVQHALAQTDSSPFKIKFLIEGGYEYGGVNLEGIYFTSDENKSLYAGEGGVLGFGGQLEFRQLKFLMIRSVLTSKLAFTGSGNGRVFFSRLPFHISSYFKVNDALRLGVGATTHFNAKVGGKGAFKNETLESSWSPRFEIGYRWIGVTYTPIVYTSEQYRLDTTTIGMFLSVPFGQKK